jgi:branched-chain amino acid transport system permease protein
VFLVAILLAATVAGIAGWLVGLPSLRLRGDYLAIVTLGFGQIIIAIVQTIKEVGGSLGFNNLPLYTTFTWVFALAILCVLTVRNLAVSSLGRAMKAVRDDEVAAAAVGINTTRIKVLAFVISSMWAGIAGALQVHLIQLAQPDSFNFVRSVEIRGDGGFGRTRFDHRRDYHRDSSDSSRKRITHHRRRVCCRSGAGDTGRGLVFPAL